MWVFFLIAQTQERERGGKAWRGEGFEDEDEQTGASERGLTKVREENLEW